MSIEVEGHAGHFSARLNPPPSVKPHFSYCLARLSSIINLGTRALGLLP